MFDLQLALFLFAFPPVQLLCQFGAEGCLLFSTD